MVLKIEIIDTLFRNAQQYPVVGRISAKGINNLYGSS